MNNFRHKLREDALYGLALGALISVVTALPHLAVLSDALVTTAVVVVMSVVLSPLLRRVFRPK